MANRPTTNGDAASDELDEAHRHAEPKGNGAGEEEGGAPSNGDDAHVKDDQKPITR